MAAPSARRRASSAPEDIGRVPAEGVDRGATHETVAGTRRAHRTRQAERPTVKATVRDLTPEIKTEFRKVIDKVLPQDPELRAKIIAIYSQNPLLKTLYEEAGFGVKYERSRR